MLIYWLLLAFPSIFALLGLRAADSRGRSDLSKSRSRGIAFGGSMMIAFWILYNLISGLRYQIGGDWIAYIDMVLDIADSRFFDALKVTDVGFALTSWIVTRVGLGLGTVNFICSGILSLGVIRVAQRTEHPWLAITAAVPYLLIVVGMGYVRQAAAIGFLLFAINAVSDRRLMAVFVYLVISTTFHFSAVVMAPLFLFAVIRRKIVAVPVGLVFMVVAIMLMAGSERFAEMQTNYFESGYSSSGAIIRIVMNAAPAALFLAVRNRMGLNVEKKKIWTLISLGSIGLLLILPFSASSTVVDRVGLIFSPIQIFVFGYLPRALNVRAGRSGLLLLGVVVYCAVVQLIWLNFADNSNAWVPYHSIISDS